MIAAGTTAPQPNEELGTSQQTIKLYNILIKVIWRMWRKTGLLELACIVQITEDLSSACQQPYSQDTGRIRIIAESSLQEPTLFRVLKSYTAVQ
jgi:hypothetical protein